MKLDVWLQQNRTLDERLRVVECLSQAVNEVHDRGQSLGALDPSHVEVGSGGECDLSAARQGSPAPGYEAPDAGGDAPPAMANVYSAGAIAWEILAGRPAGDSPPHLHKVRSDVPRELADAVMACLERSADWRPKDLTYLAQMAAAQQKSAEAPRTAPRAASRAARTARPTSVRAGHRGPARRTWPLLVALVVVVGLAAGAAWQYLGAGLVSSSGAATTPTPPATVAAAPATPPTAEPPGVEPTPTPVTPVATPTPVAATPAPPLTDPGASSARTPPARPPAAVPTPTPVPPEPAAPTPTPVPPAPEPVRRLEPAAAQPNPAPRVQPPPVNPEPQAAPPAEAAPPAPLDEVAPPAPPAEPVLLTAVSPLEVRRPGKVLLDLRGSGFRSDLQARILPLTKAPRGIAVLRQKFVNPTLITVLVELGENAETGEFAIAVEDASGARSEHAVFTVTK